MTNNQDPDADLVEVVARAICRADPEVRMGDADGVVEQRVHVEWHRYGWQARAAITAIDLPARLQAAKDAGREDALEIVKSCFEEKEDDYNDDEQSAWTDGAVFVQHVAAKAIRERIGKP